MYQNNWKPFNGYQQTQATTGGGIGKVEPGIYICKILNVSVRKSKSGNEQFVFEFDIAQGEYANYYSKLYEKFGGDWKGLYYQLTGLEGNTQSQGFFKGLIESIENSNRASWEQSGFSFDWFRGKVFAGVFGEEEYLYNGDIKISCKLRYINDVNKIGDLKMPEMKKLSNNEYNSYASNSSNYPPPNNSYSGDYAPPSKPYPQVNQEGFYTVEDPTLPF